MRLTSNNEYEYVQSHHKSKEHFPMTILSAQKSNSFCHLHIDVFVTHILAYWHRCKAPYMNCLIWVVNSMPCVMWLAL